MRSPCPPPIWSRRDLLRLGGAAAVFIVTPAWAGGHDRIPEYRHGGALGATDMFQHGVASGDPLPDGIILWTRVSPDHGGRVEVFWEMARDASFTDRVAAGTVRTDERRDWTLKVDVRGLRGGRDYYYRFLAEGRESPTGKTRLAPPAGAAVERVRVGLASCFSISNGYPHAYAKMVAQDLDAVLHLGDYIYEYGDGGFGNLRPYEPTHEIVTLQDYRARHAQYKREPQLQALHAEVPFVVVWDDHEIANDAWKRGAENHQPEEEGPYRRRKLAAQRAYFEWMPMRPNGVRQIARAFAYGDLVDLVMIDTRHLRRALQIGNTIGPEVLDDPPGRQLLGRRQEGWLRDRLVRSDARWKLIGNQVVMAQLKIPVGGTELRPIDSWDGYPGSRRRFLAMLQERGIRNVVVCTGDIHASGAGELSQDPFAAPDPIATEIVTPGITSGFPLPGLIDAVLGANPHIKYAEASRRGYVLLDITAERLQAQWWLLDGVEDPAGASETLAQILEVADGDPRLRAVGPASPSGAFV